MALLGYKERFVEPLRNGTKCGTIRALRRYPILPDDRLYHYTGLRTNHAMKIGESDCLSVSPIEIKVYGEVITVLESCELVKLPKTDLTKKVLGDYSSAFTVKQVFVGDHLNDFARGDGFENWEEMRDFWINTHGVKKNGRKVLLLPFKGIWIQHTPVEHNHSRPSPPIRQIKGKATQ